MLDKVIIYDIKLKNKYVSPLEIRQLMGRAGRTYNAFQQGEVYIFGKEEDDEAIENYFYGKDNEIKSNLKDNDIISFHILPDIASGEVKKIEDIKKWFSGSLSAFQGNSIDENEIFLHLIDCGCIDENFNVLLNGNLSINFYYTPKRIKVLNEKLDYIFQIDDFSTMAFAWLFSYYSGYKVFHNLYFEFMDNKSSKYYLDNDEEFDFFVYYLILNNRSVKKIGSYIEKSKKDIFRLIATIREISNHKELNIEKNLKLIETQLYYNVNTKIANLMHDIGIFDKKAVEILYELGIKDYNDMKEKIDHIKSYADFRTYKSCVDFLNSKGDYKNVESN